MTLWKWSTDPATNGSADSTCPWPEGMAPSQVNDSARGTMAAIAKYRDDVSGKIVTGGTSSAYTVTSNQVFDTLAHLDGAMIAFVPHADSAAAPTLNVDGLGAKPLRGWTGTDLLTGVLKAGTPYIAFYNNSNGEFVLHSYAVNPGEVPIGAGIDYWGATVPSDNWVFPYGQAISRTTYATCFARLGTTYGSGDGSTTFNMPDKRGRVSAAYDAMGGSAASRLSAFWAAVGIGGGSQTNTIARSDLPNVAPTFSGLDTNVTVNSLNTDILRGAIKDPVQGTQAGSSFFMTSLVSNGVAAQQQTSTGVIVPKGSVGSLNGGVTQTAINNMQPTITCNYILRVK